MVSAASNGGDIESIDSIKYFAPRLYSSQYRAVTARDYESIVQQVYPNTESVSVVGGEEVEPEKHIAIGLKTGDGIAIHHQLLIPRVNGETNKAVVAKVSALCIVDVNAGEHESDKEIVLKCRVVDFDMCVIKGTEFVASNRQG